MHMHFHRVIVCTGDACLKLEMLGGETGNHLVSIPQRVHNINKCVKSILVSRKKYKTATLPNTHTHTHSLTHLHIAMENNSYIHSRSHSAIFWRFNKNPMMMSWLCVYRPSNSEHFLCVIYTHFNVSTCQMVSDCVQFKAGYHPLTVHRVK